MSNGDPAAAIGDKITDLYCGGCVPPWDVGWCANSAWFECVPKSA